MSAHVARMEPGNRGVGVFLYRNAWLERQRPEIERSGRRWTLFLHLWLATVILWRCA